MMFSINYLFERLDMQQIASAFVVLFAVIDVLGSTPIFISLKQQGRPVNAWKATLISLGLLLGFFFAGDAMLRLFNVDIASFAVAGSFTTLLSLRAEYASINIIIGLLLNMLFVFVVLKATDKVERIISPAAIYLLRKFFGIILLAISVRLFTANLSALISLQ